MDCQSVGRIGGWWLMMVCGGDLAVRTAEDGDAHGIRLRCMYSFAYAA